MQFKSQAKTSGAINCATLVCVALALQRKFRQVHTTELTELEQHKTVVQIVRQMCRSDLIEHRRTMLGLGNGFCQSGVVWRFGCFNSEQKENDDKDPAALFARVWRTPT